jgi:hypothetical protein
MKPSSLCQITLLFLSTTTGNHVALYIVIKRECEHSSTTAQINISNVSVNWQLTFSWEFSLLLSGEMHGRHSKPQKEGSALTTVGFGSVLESTQHFFNAPLNNPKQITAFTFSD